MLSINPPSNQDLDEYWNSFKGEIYKSVLSTNISFEVNSLLTDTKLREILFAVPGDMIALHNEVLSCLIHDYNATDYDSYLSFLDIPEPDRTNSQNDLISKYLVVNRLSEIFDYDRFISANKVRSYALARKLNINTCTYCNRSYTTTVVVKDEVTGRENNSGRIIRPNFDHWLPKGKYPALALSYYNLIPCCPICNSYLKGDKVFSLDSHSHPYLKDSIEEYKFSYRLEATNELSVKINSPKGSKIEKTLQDFRLEEIYNSHANFELKDLYDLRLKYPKNYLKALFTETFKEIPISEREIYRMIFGIEVEAESFHQRPFSKFKNDIINELNELE